MGEKLIVGPIKGGLSTNVTAFNINNDSFPVLINAYQYRDKIKRKRGTSFISRLQRYFDSNSTSYTDTPSFTLDNETGNIVTGFELEENASIVPGTLNLDIGGDAYTDPDEDGTLYKNAVLDVGSSINYATGEILINGGGFSAVSGTFIYYPTLPVMGLEDLSLNASQFPDSLNFDTVYSYFTIRTSPYLSYNVSYYKNPTTGTYTGYTQKTDITKTNWNGQDYQQFWTINYEGSLWACNGVTDDFDATNIGMQFKNIENISVTSGTTVNLTITGHGLVEGDFLFINEVTTTTGINFQTGYVTVRVSDDIVTVVFPNATIATNSSNEGIAQYLTNRADETLDCIRFYDGDPTNESATSPILNGRKGWVNFCPPLSQNSFSISARTEAQYYLVGAKIIATFKDRLLFIGPVIQTSSPNSQIYLQDTIVYSQNGTPYYTASFTGDPVSVNTEFNPILVPENRTAVAPAWFEDQIGFGGFITLGLDEPIISVSTNEDALILGFSNQQVKCIYTGDDLIPFNFYVINSEYGTSSTFSAINTDEGVISRGAKGIIISGQTQVQRIDNEILDQVFKVKLNNNGNERFTAIRDFINEWIYFSYPSDNKKWDFPTETLLYNYRENTWALFEETYTTYGTFRKKTGYTWATIGNVYPTWASWTVPWSSGKSTLLENKISAGNTQGFIVERDDGTGEAKSLAIQDISSNTITSPNHCLNVGDYIVISDCIGTIASEVNDKIFSVANATTDTFDLNPTIGSGTYLGLGLIKRMYVPFIQTKQFPSSWGMGRKTRIGVQRYLLTKTNNSQIQLMIFLSQNNEDPYNLGPIVPEPGSENNSLIYSTILYTCPESTNLGLTPANVNLQMPTAIAQQQIWHRKNTSLIGDTIQLGFTMSDAQMRDTDFKNQFAEIELHGFILDLYPSQELA